MLTRVGIGAAALYLAVSGAMSSDFVPIEIVQLCSQRWGTDYVMKEFCINNQLEAMRRLQESGAFYGPAPTAVAKKSKPKVGDYVCEGGVPCDHSDVK